MSPERPPLSDQQLDQLLASLPDEPLSPALRRQLLAFVDAPPVSRGQSWWPFGPLWQPAAVLACSLLLGMGVGLLYDSAAEPWPLATGEEIGFILFGPGEEE
ncbi:MAG: hypothetical protein HQM06_09645 [Magnetococcales bacterium]|nr:hypothetical protein [Magnetococcales bacterium]